MSAGLDSGAPGGLSLTDGGARLMQLKGSQEDALDKLSAFLKLVREERALDGGIATAGDGIDEGGESAAGDGFTRNIPNAPFQRREHG
jgi:hypothetical protein